MSAHRARLAAAVAVFKELGWDKASRADAASLPLGTPEQQATAKAGLKSGPWSQWGETPSGGWGENSYTDVDEAMLALFAIRQGVDAARAASVAIPDHRALTEVVAQRSDAFAAAFIEAVSSPRWRMSEHGPTFFGPTTLTLVAQKQLPVPQDLEYLKDFAVYACEALSPGHPTFGGLSFSNGSAHAWSAPEEVLRPRFEEHTRLAVELGVQGSGPLSAAIPGAVAAGWMDPGDALGLAFQGLETAQRPGDRKAWVALILGELGATQAELVERADALVPLLGGGEAVVIESLAPLLIDGVPEEQLPDVALAALSVSTAKGRRTVLKALTKRGVPSGWAAGEADGLDELLASIVAPWAAGRDRSLASASARFLEAWGLVGLSGAAGGLPDAAGPGFPDGRQPGWQDAGPAHGVPGAHVGDGGVGHSRAWRATPALWDAPALTLEPPGPDAFRKAAVAVSDRLHPDVDGEVFLAQLNALAWQDAEAAKREVLAWGSRTYEADQAKIWASDGALPNHWGQPETVMGWRDFSVLSAPGRAPALLSTPSRVDMSISGADLVARLGAYREAGVSAAEADLLVALLRLDHASVTPEQLAALRQLDVPVRSRKGEPLGASAGALAAGHVGDPVIAPGFLSREKRDYFKRQRYETPASLRPFTLRLAETPQYSYRDDSFTLFPFWGDTLHAGSAYSGANRNAWVWRQVARGSRHLSPGVAMNLLAVQRPGELPAEAQDRALALREAWERGLLTPGTADAALLEWAYEPDRLAALGTTLLELGLEEGLASVVWPLLDDFLAIAGAKTRMLAGAAELAEAALELAPIAVEAVRSGLAQASALRTPGLHAMAERTGSSRAVRAAREAVALLDAAEEGPGASAAPAPQLSEGDFEASWTSGLANPQVLEDGVRVEMLEADEGSTKRLLAVLTLPDEPGLLMVDKGSYYGDLVQQKAFQAELLPDDGSAVWPVPRGERAHRKLSWDPEAQRVVALKFSGKYSGLPLPQSFATLVVALVSQNGHAGSRALEAAHTLADAGDLGSARVGAAVRCLLGQDAVAPARLAAAVGKRAGYLSALWPLLAEPIAWAAAQPGTLPRWLGRLLDEALDHAPVLREAAARGLKPAAWEGLEELAARPGKSTVVAKAKALKEALS